MSGLVIGLFAGASDAEIALNNLAEAGYDESMVSVVTNSASRTQKLTAARGELSQVAIDRLPARLAALGLPAADAQSCGARVAAGAILIAVAAPDGSEDAAAEILGDQKAELVRRLPGGASGA
jgi:hypothetical protein